MQIKVDSTTYLAALEETLSRIVFDRSSGESFSFKELFYPLEIDEGKYAFQSYAEQMQLAEKLGASNSVSSNALGLSILERIQLYQRRNNVSTLPAVQSSTIASSKSPNQDENDIKTISKQILAKIEGSELPPELSEESSVDLLQVEQRYDHSSLIIHDNPRNSRVLAIANAGHGKTTLLRRIALYYCHPLDDEENETDEVKDKYNLKGNYIPCIILLRDITDKNFSVAKAIEKSIITVFKGSYPEELDSSMITRVQKWISATRNNLLLLIDGLDELSDSMRYNFLSALDDYLLSNPQTHVIMTSRVAGLSESKIQFILRKMGFRGRSIIPLEGDSAREYAERWIDVTQPVEFREQFKSNLEQILRQKKFKDYKELLRTPAELLMILKQIANDTLSSNRFQMFHDILWGYFTDHVKRYDQKRPIFEDTMTLLSFLAYQMQLNDSMFISLHELQKLSEELSHLSFHTNIINNGTLDDYREVLDSIAANVGIIERDDRTSNIVYTFPIRAYQEFLTAYACCHLRLNTELSKPDPFGILCQHLDDSRWISITNFALLDLGTSNQQAFDSIINLIFKEVTDIEQLRAVVEADLAITKDHATILCENVFSEPVMTDDQKELLVACMNTKTAYAYVYALNAAYQSAPAEDSFLEANALSTIIWEYNSNHSAIKKALSFVQKGTKAQMTLGTEMISIMSRTMMDEVSAAYQEKVRKDLTISDDLLVTLVSNAKLQKDVHSVTALTNIWLSKIEGSGKAKVVLDEELALLVIDELNQKIPIIQKLCFGGRDAVKSSDYKQIQEIVFTLGSIPFSSRTMSLLNHDQGNLFVSTLLQAMYQNSKDDVDVDQVAIATACLYYCWDINRFMEAWTAEICKGMPSEYVRKDMCSIREQNHFDLVKKSLAKLERAYREEHRRDLNNISSIEAAIPSDPVFSLFRSGDCRGAANYCIRTMGTGNANKTNLAFLLRYGHINQSDLDSQTEFTIPGLLSEGVKNQERFSLVNMALYELGQNHYSRAKALLAQITTDGWQDVSERFWYPELWRRTKDPEGALVCVLAHINGDCEFDDYEEMVEAVKLHYEGIAEKVLRI